MTSVSFPISYHNELFDQLPYKETYFNNTWLVVPKKLINFLENFIAFKKIYGSPIEKIFYSEDITTPGALVKRLFQNRAITFTGAADSYTLRDGTRGVGHWEDVGTSYESGKLVLKEYLSYDEIELASFVSFSCLTPFINNGSRHNAGQVGQSYEPNGVYVGQVGARFQKQGRMEYRFMMIDPEQNTKENGYGPDNTSVNGQFLSLWANFLGVDYFPTHEEAMKDPMRWFGRKPTEGQSAIAQLNVEVYKRRIGINAEVFLKEANDRAMKVGKHAFCHAVGLGLGVWAFDKKLQQRLTVEVYLDILNTNKYEHIRHLYFAWFLEVGEGSEFNWPNQVNGVSIHFGKREPAEPLNDDSLLLVANWAWDANSYIGNEYWDGMLSTSGDPAAASCSFIAYFGHLKPISEVHTW